MKFCLVFLLFFGLYTHANDNSDEYINADELLTPLPIQVGLGGVVSWGIDSFGLFSNNDGSLFQPINNLSLVPIAHLGYRNYKRIINLSESSDSSFNFFDESEGFLVIQSRSIQYGLGGFLSTEGMKIPFGGSVFVGLTPYKGSSTFKVKKVYSFDETKRNLDSMKVPKNINELEQLSIGDTISYSSVGAVRFSVGVGLLSVFEFSRGYLAKGVWSNTITKIDDSKVFVSIKNTKIKSFMKSKKAQILLLDKQNFKNTDKDFNFTFDLNNPVSVDAYLKSLRGDLTTAQKLSLLKKAGVSTLTSNLSKSVGNIKRYVLGVPVLYKRSGLASKAISENYSRNIKTGEKIETDIGMYVRSYRTRGYFSNKKNTGFVFMAQNNKLLKSEKYLKNKISVKFKWYFQNKNSHPNYIYYRLRRARQVFGYDNLSNLDLSQLEGHGSLLFTRGEIDVPISNETLENILSSDVELLKRKFKENSLSKLEHFLSKSNSNLDLFCPGHFKNRCIRKLKSSTKLAVKKIIKESSGLNRLYVNDNSKELIKSLTQIGRSLLSNRFVFQEYFKLIDNTIPKANFSIQGTKFSKVNLEL